jgi:hypothetical protein
MKISRQPLLCWVYLGLSCVLLHGGQAIAQSDTSSATVIEERSAETDMLRGVLAAMDNAFEKVETIHYRRTSDIHAPEWDIKRYHKNTETLEQVYQKEPRSSYVIGSAGTWLYRGQESLSIVPEQKKIVSRVKKEGHPRTWLDGVNKFNSESLLHWYDLEVEQLTRTPYFLFTAYEHLDTKELYDQKNLYRLVGSYQERFIPKDPNEYRSPPISKIEFYLDADVGLVVGIREYWWHDQKDTSRGDYLAVSDIVMEWREFKNGVVLPMSGIRHEASYGNDPAKTILWDIDYSVVNKSIDSEVFSVEDYHKSQGYEEW